MSTDKGYIKLYRDIRDHWLWEDKPFAKGQAWSDLLMLVNHEDKILMFDGHPIKVIRGMCITSLHKLADRWGWSTGKVSRFLNDLESEVMIRQERNTKRTTVSIVNYDIYQESRNSKRNSHETLTKHSRNTDETKQDTIEDTIEGTKKKYPLNPPTEDDDEDWDSGWQS